MKNPKFWWAFIAFLVVWSLFEIYPPSNQSLIQEFKKDSDLAKQDGAYRNIVSNAEFLQLKNPDPSQEFAVLTNAIGTNDIQGYFPYYNVKGDERPTYAILNILQKKASGKIHLGLDLQGGTEFLVSLETNRVVSTDTNLSAVNATQERQRLVTQASDILRKRVDALGVAEPVITPSGDDILIQLPGLSQSAQDEARKNIQKAAYLEFRLVNPQSDEYLTQNPPLIPPGYEVLRMKQKAADGTVSLYPLLLEKKPAYGLTGANIKSARANRDPSGNPEIEVEFDADGAKKFGKLTTDHWKGSDDPARMAIVLDGEVVTAPGINEPILGGRCSISGGAMDINEAISDANALENPLEAPVHIDSVRQVDPTLGKDSIKSGLYSAVAGTLLVVVFMAFYYHRCGVIADIAMLLNLVISLGIMCYMQTTFTLPGIAGVVLTVGMAVDANVLIYERLREEMALGKSMRSALSAAYSRAFGTIFDSHTTTLISAIVLWNMGTGPVKGFGATLTIGVALSLFTALVVTRLIFDFLLSRGWLNKVGMLHVIKNLDWDFMKWTKATYVLSAVVIIMGFGWAVHRGKGIMGPDFAGGDAVTLSFAEKVDVDKLRTALSKVGQAEIQYQRGAGAETLEVVAGEGEAGTVTNTLLTTFPTAGFKVIGNTSVGASVGEGIQKSALIASFVALACIMFYVALRYEFSFAIGAVLAVVHDILVTMGIFFMTGRQLSAPMVAAVLTIIGFSLNDKVVIFDRIREDLKLAMRGSFREIINKAINQTLSRTIITSGTVFLSTMALFLYGGGVINDFAFTFLVGIVTGTYSSIYIACALVLWWHKGERPKTGTQVTMQSATAPTAPKPTPAPARP